MKPRIQITPALGAALTASLLWFAFWLIAFRPADIRPAAAGRPPARLMPLDGRAVPAYSSPTLFALPAKDGFSDSFPADRVTLNLTFDAPEQPPLFLEAGFARQGDPNRAPLYHAVKPTRAGLRRPKAAATAASHQPGIRITVSPELQPRADALTLSELTGDLPAYTRVRIRVEPDGGISRCFFETPPQNSALPIAVRGLRFAPGPQAIDSWIEIRYTPEETT